MYTDADRKEYLDFLKQVELIKASKILDRAGDGQVSLNELPTIMALLGEPKMTKEREDEIKAIIMKDMELDGETSEIRIELDVFLKKVRDCLKSFGSQKEVVCGQAVHRGLQDFR